MFQLPNRLTELLNKDQALYSFVLGSAATVAPWARDNKTIFFPEYTDHSLVHLNEVVSSADSLITDAAWSHLTPEDAALLATSVLLHDSALHLSEDGFFELISGSYGPTTSKYVQGDQSWPELWTDFLAEASRFDQRKLRSLFGDTDPIPSVPSTKLDLTLRHRLLIGEFLRRHHARLAHEIAVIGIPGPDGRRVSLGATSIEFLDLCGFVARSHNLSLRSAVDLLESAKRRIHLNCHVPFIMAVLRIADYIQIHSARAPKQLLHLKSLTSPMSRGEWRKHEAILELNQAHEDPEAIYVDAYPPDVQTFLSLQKLFGDIQGDLDQVWAVLGEVYGRFAPLDALGIAIRRIRSSLDDPQAFARQKKLAYIPRRFRFRTASSELMDLLVAPLYGNRPAIGIRELVQNAVDACLERDDLVDKGRISRGELTDESDVVISLYAPEKADAKLIVEDHGVGMSLDVIDSYFLNIGASFRSSDIWRKNHEVDGHSTVHRTGRFGIGVLAAFLLGDEMTVTTSHIASANGEGFTFKCRRGDESIEVRQTKFHHGTKIEIPLSNAVAQKLRLDEQDWDWYCVDKPRVVRRMCPSRFDSSEAVLKQRFNVPNCDESIEGTEWKRLESPDFDDVLWTFKAQWYRGQVLICNGIHVTSSLYSITPQLSPQLGLIRVEAPSLVVFDPDGRLPINLQRSGLVGALPFRKELEKEVAAQVVADLIDAFKGSSSAMTIENVKLAAEPKIRGSDRERLSRPAIAAVLLTKDGILPADLAVIASAKPTSILLDPTNIAAKRGNWANSSLVSSVDCYASIDPVTDTKQSRILYIRASLPAGERGWNDGFAGALPVVGRRVLLRKSEVAELVAPGRVPRSLWNKLKLEQENEVWGLWSQGAVPPWRQPFDQVVADVQAQAYGFSILYLDWNLARSANDKVESTPFSEAWLARVHKPILSVITE
jgi:molecular chaperone HtpG